ncbi:MAG: DNA primase [Hydrogenophilales bacterium]|nr:DNA primase [Hydrogenophilales bacterium]
MIPQDFIHLLLDRVDIVEVIERYVPLKKKGANYQACCPFHNEKSPSFTVSPTKQFYHCFGCGAHGTAISFMMEHAGLDFPEAVKDLAARVGMNVPDDGQGRKPEDGRRDALNTAMEQASRHYIELLKGSEKAIAYLKSRGLTGETAARFALGYAPDEWQGLAKAVENYQDAALEEAGLVIAGEGKRYDRFRDRVMFPIRNERGRVIAFGGRVLGQGEPKYLNSPETPLFHKGRELYGLHENRRGIQNAGYALVVEGYMDVVMLAQHGVDNALATLGTAVTPDHVAKIFRLVDRVIFAFDGDAAGRKAAWRGLENALPQLPDGKQVSFLFLPEGEDPDSYVRDKGEAAFRDLCRHAMPLSDYLFETLRAQTDMSSQEGRVRLLKLMEPYLAQMRHAPLLARTMRARLGDLTGIAAPSVRRDPRSAPRPVMRREVMASPYRVVIQALLARPERAHELPERRLVHGNEAAALESLAAYIKEHPEMTQTRRIVDAFKGRDGYELIETAFAESMLLGSDAETEARTEADFQGACATLMEQWMRAERERLVGLPLSQLTGEEKRLLVEGPRYKKLDQVGKVKT